MVYHLKKNMYYKIPKYRLIVIYHICWFEYLSIYIYIYGIQVFYVLHS